MRTANEIKKNLLKKLEIVWQKNEEDIDDLIKYDPVVRLFFHALIYQFEDVYNYLAEFKKEILSDLGKRLIPNNHYFASPSFGILKANPSSLNDSIYKLKPDKTFSTQRKIKDKITSLNFIPASETMLLPGSLEIIAGKNTIYNLYAKDEIDKLQIINSDINDSDRIIWLGLNIPEDAFRSAKKITFFINYDFNKIENKLYFQELLNAEWSAKNKVCDVSMGFNSSTAPESVMSRVSRFEMTTKRVLGFFCNNFITLDFEEIDQGRSNVAYTGPPDELTTKCKTIRQWISVKCNSAIPIDFFLKNPVSINAFPVLNCNIKTDRLTKNELIKNFKLEDEEYFFELYYPEGFRVDDGFTIRNTRYQSFDSKDLAMELRVLNRLFNQSRILFENNNHLEEEEINIFRDFSNVLSDLDTRFKNESVKTADENISTIETFDRVKEYKYTTTYGEHGNGGETGDPFKYNGPGLDEKSIVALTTFNGGRNPLEEEESIDRFRYLLLSRDRIVTHGTFIDNTHLDMTFPYSKILLVLYK